MKFQLSRFYFLYDWHRVLDYAAQAGDNMKAKQITKKERKKAVKKIGKYVGCITVCASLFAALNGIVDFGKFLSSTQKPEYKLDTHSEWMDMECIESILTGKSVLKVYSRAAGWDWVEDTSPNLKENELLDGISLVTLFSNRENFDRNIIRFFVSITNITENLLPDLELDYPPDTNGCVGIGFRNNGWGESGEMQLSITGFHFSNPLDSSIADISLNSDTENRWFIPSILPGEKGEITDIRSGDFNIQWKNFDIPSVSLFMEVELFSPKLNYTVLIKVPIIATPDDIHSLEPPGMGGPDDIRYGIPVDTSQKSAYFDYMVYQCIPANEQVRLPVLIYPTKSCSMDIQISFELDDGEIIKVPPISNVSIKVPFYQNWREYKDGKYLDEDQLERNDIYFPFENNPYILPD